MVWKHVLPLATLIALASAGGRTLSAQESAQFLSLFRRYCSDTRSSPTQDGNTFYYCKTSDQGPITQQITHDAEIQPGDTPKQVIFVQPPPTNYIHNVALRGSPGNPQETEIYVLPSSADHNLQLQDTRSAVQAVKPSLYFLSGEDDPRGPGGSGGSQGGNRPPPIGRPGGQQGGNGQRPSSPPPGSNNQGAIGIGTGLSGGGVGGGNSGDSGGYSLYGPPALTPRNQRNVPQRNYRTI